MEPPAASENLHHRGPEDKVPADISSADLSPISAHAGDRPRTVPTAALAVSLAELATAVADPGDGRVVWLTARSGRKVAAGFSGIDQLHDLAVTDPDALVRRMFSVKVAGDVIAIDVDDPSRAAAAESFTQTCEGHDVACVVVDSGRPGHVHIWARPADEQLGRFLVDQARQLGLEVRTGNFMRPPGSANALGPVTVHGGIDRALSALAHTGADWDLGPGPAPRLVAVPRRNRRSELPRLSRAIVAVLREGDDSPSRSHTLQRVVTGMVNAGWELDDAWELLSRTRFAGAAKLTQKLHRYGEDTAYTYLAHCWASARRFVDEHPAHGADPVLRTALESFQRAADAHRWPGRAGSIAWLVLHRLIHTAYRGGCEWDEDSVTLTASERQLAEDASLSREAVHRALKSLCAAGWLTRVAVGAGPMGSRWRLELNGSPARTAVPLTHPTHCSSPTGGVVVNGLSMRAGHDAFRSRALGPTGYRVLRELVLHGPATTAELAGRLGQSQGTVARVLAKRLGAAGMVERLGPQWGLLESVYEPDAGSRTGLNRSTGPTTSVSHLVLDAAAERFGTTGRAVAQRRWHQRERELYAATASYRAVLERAPVMAA